MAKRINKTLVGFLTAAGFAVMTLAGIGMVFALRQTDPRHYEKLAKEHADADDFEQARLYYLRAFDVSNPKRPEYLVHAGEMLFEQGDEFRARGMWERAIVMDPELTEAHEKLIDINIKLAQMGRYPWRKVTESAKKLRDVDSENAMALYSMGLALMKLPAKDAREIMEADPRYEDYSSLIRRNTPNEQIKSIADRAAIGDIHDARRLAPEVVEYSLRLVQHYVGQGVKLQSAGKKKDANAEFDEAEGMLTQLVAENQTPGEDATNVRLSYAWLLDMRERFEAAEEVYRSAEQFTGDDPEVRALFKAQHAKYWNRRAAAADRDLESGVDSDPLWSRSRALLEDAIETYPDGFDAYMVLANLLAYRADRAGAIAVCEQRINRGIERTGYMAWNNKWSLYQLLVRAADECLLYANASLDRASPEFDEYVAKAEGFANDAEAEIPQLPEGQHSLAKVRFTQGRNREAISLLERAERAQTDLYGAANYRISKFLAQLQSNEGQSGAAKEAIVRAKLDPNADLSCWIIHSNILVQTNELDEANKVIDEVLRQVPDNADAIKSKVRILRLQGQKELADRYERRIKRDTPEERFAEAQRIREDNPDKALAIVEALLAKAPAERNYLRLAVDVLTEQERFEEGKTLVDRALADDPNNEFVQWLGILTDPSYTDEQRDQAQQDLIENTKDPFERSFRLMQWYARKKQKDDYRVALQETIRLMDDPQTKLDSVTRRVMLRELIERLLVASAEDKNSESIERAVQWAIKENIDGADGQTYRGRAHMAAGEVELALTAFNLALNKQPTHAMTLSYMAQCYMNTKPPQIEMARSHYARSVVINPNLGSAHRGLALISLLQKDSTTYEREFAECQRLIPNDRWVRDQLLMREEQRNPNEGIQRRLEIREREPDNINNLIRLARLYADPRINRMNQAEECVEALLQSPNVERPGVISAVEFFREIKKPERALEILEALVERTEEPEEKARAQLHIVNHWANVGDSEKLEEALRKAAAITESLDVCTTYAKHRKMTGDYPAALEWYDKGIKLAEETSPSQAAALRREKIDVYFRAGDARIAEGEIDDYISRYPDDPNGKAMLSVVQSLSGDIDGAIASLRKYIEQKPNDLHALVRRARLYGGQGRWALAITDLERLRSIDPTFDNFKPRLLLADGYSLTQQLPKAFAELDSIIRTYPRRTKAVASHLIRLYLEHNRLSDGIRIANSLANRYPDDPQWIRLRGDIYSRLGDANAALADFERAAELSEFRPSYAAAMMETCADFNQLDRGLKYYEQAVPQDRRTPAVIVRYADLLGRSGKIDQSIEQFRTALAHAGFGNIRFMRNLIGTIRTALNGQNLVDLFRLPPEDPNLQRANRHVLAVLLMEGEQFSEAMAALEALQETAEDAKEKISLLGSIGTVFERQNDWEGAKTAYERMLETDDRNLLALNNLAYLLSDKLGLPREGLPYAKRAVDVLPIPTILDTLGWTHVQLLEYREARSVLSRAVQQDPRFVPALYHLGEAYRRSGDLESAKLLLTSAKNLTSEGVGKQYRDKIIKSLKDVGAGRSEP